jgi:hypothetical protein
MSPLYKELPPAQDAIVVQHIWSQRAQAHYVEAGRLWLCDHLSVVTACLPELHGALRR